MIQHFGMFGASWDHRHHSCGLPYHGRLRFSSWRKLSAHRNTCGKSPVWIFKLPNSLTSYSLLFQDLNLLYSQCLNIQIGYWMADAAHLLNTQKTAAPRIEKASFRLFLTLDLVCSLASVKPNTSYRILIQVNTTRLVKGENPSRLEERSCQGLQI